MILISNQRFEIGYSDDDVKSRIITKLKLNSIDDIKEYKIIKESLDSRKHNDIHYQLSIGVFSEKEKKIVKLVNSKNVMLTNPANYTFPHIINTDVRDFLDIADEYRPVIIGSGPAGYHAAVKLAYGGFRPIVIERGRPVELRVKDVEDFWASDKSPDPDSNVCFGEGGAGTFSDGKLNTGNKDKNGYFKEVLDTFVRFGADPSVAYKSKPHIGTDELRNILKNMREYIEKYGGEVRFNSKLTDIEYETSIDTFGYESEIPIYELTIEGPDGEYKHKTHSVILAIGHSARDTYKMLENRFFTMEKKAFAVGIRVEHKADTINRAMYGEDYLQKYGDKLPQADYKLVYHTGGENGSETSRSVFSFCMCPGGYVVNSSTEEGELVINGMSYSGRDGVNSNSAIVVNVNPEDFDGDDLMAGVRFQKRLEENAFKEGHGRIPVQLYGDYKNDSVSDHLGNITPEIKGKFEFADLKKIFPDFINASILEAMEAFGNKINGYDDPDTVFSAVESRTSSPLRILRNEDLMAVNFPGIVPSGEGAGYAGGITSAAADGIKAAEAISEYLTSDLIESYKAYEISKYM